MQSSQIPSSKFQIPFANGAGSGYIRQVPVASQISITPGAASLTDGFPPLTFIAEGAGGIPPFGQDMNGILNEITAWIQWGNAGAPVSYDATFSAAIGGYPKGSLLTSAAGGSWWLSMVENNTTDPDTGGAGWLYLSYGLTYGGNPNGNVAGVAATNGALAASLLWDTVHSLLWVCTTTGTATTAVWTSSAPISGAVWCGASTGTGNGQILAVPFASFAIGTGLSWLVGASQTNTGAASVTVGTFGTFPLRKDSPTGPIALTGNELVSGNIISARFDGTYVHLSNMSMGTAAQANASSPTGTVAAVTGGTTAGNLAAFSDAFGTVKDSGVSIGNKLIALSTNHTIAASEAKSAYVASTALTLTVPATSTLFDGFHFSVSATNGNVVVMPSGADKINGATAGTSYTVPSGTSMEVVTDGAGNINTFYQTFPPPLTSAAPVYINATTAITAGQYLVDTSGGAFSLTLPAAPVAGTAIRFTDAAETFMFSPLTVIPGGTDTVAGSTQLICDINGADVLLWYKSGNWSVQ